MENTIADIKDKIVQILRENTWVENKFDAVPEGWVGGLEQAADELMDELEINYDRF